MLNEALAKFRSWVSTTSFIVALCSYVRFLIERAQNIELLKKVRRLQAEKAENENKKIISDMFKGKSDSDIIDAAIDKGSKMSDRQGS